MLLKDNIKLPYGFKPTKKQLRRINNGCIVKRCQNCGDYFTSKRKKQFYCSNCYRIMGKSAPES
jgi:protein-arginine kinase activator protein McsA